MDAREEAEALREDALDSRLSAVQKALQNYTAHASPHNAAVVRYLAAHGEDLDGYWEGLETPLHYATRRGQIDIVTILLRHGASVDSRNGALKTPLRLAVDCAHHNVALVRLLLAHGADPTIEDLGFCSPLRQSIVKDDTEGPRMMLDCCGVDINAQCGNATPLQIACSNASVGMVRLLLDRGARDVPTDTGSTPLMFAVMQHNPAAKDVIQLLCERGFDIERTDNAGRTALYWACEIHSNVSVRTLLARGACINQKAHCGTSPLVLVCYTENRHTTLKIAALFDSYLGPYYQQRLILDVAGKRSAANHPTSARHRVAADPHLSRYLAGFLFFRGERHV